jgi:hypothetical protein
MTDAVHYRSASLRFGTAGFGSNVSLNRNYPLARRKVPEYYSVLVAIASNEIRRLSVDVKHCSRNSRDNNGPLSFAPYFLFSA